MNAKEGIKLGAALAIIAVAVGLFVFRTRAAAEAGEDSKSYWYCTKTQKGFDVSNEDYDRCVRTGRKTLAPGAANADESTSERVRVSDTIVTQAKSPYSDDWTGVPASKCGDCKEIFPLNIDARGDNLCPKCNWNPATGMKGPSNPTPPGEKSG
ncbi:MAG: hypothetical protein AABZ08_05425 [Planctomycetota bacterium]